MNSWMPALSPLRHFDVIAILKAYLDRSDAAQAMGKVVGLHLTHGRFDSWLAAPGCIPKRMLTYIHTMPGSLVPGRIT